VYTGLLHLGHQNTEKLTKLKTLITAYNAVQRITLIYGNVSELKAFLSRLVHVQLFERVYHQAFEKI
jgi:hypothetical protein